MAASKAVKKTCFVAPCIEKECFDFPTLTLRSVQPFELSSVILHHRHAAGGCSNLDAAENAFIGRPDVSLTLTKAKTAAAAAASSSSAAAASRTAAATSGGGCRGDGMEELTSSRVAQLRDYIQCRFPLHLPQTKQRIAQPGEKFCSQRVLTEFQV